MVHLRKKVAEFLANCPVRMGQRQPVTKADCDELVRGMQQATARWTQFDGTKTICVQTKESWLASKTSLPAEAFTSDDGKYVLFYETNPGSNPAARKPE